MISPVLISRAYVPYTCVDCETLFRNKKFMLDEMFQKNTSKFVIFLEYENISCYICRMHYYMGHGMKILMNAKYYAKKPKYSKSSHGADSHSVFLAIVWFLEKFT